MLDVAGLFEGLLLIENGNLLYLLIAFAANVVAAFLISWKYSTIIGYMEEKFPLKESFKTTCIAQFSSFVLPFRAASFVTKPVLAKKFSEIPIKKGVLATAIYEFHELSAQIVLISTLFLIMGEGLLRDSVMILAVTVAALIAVILTRNRLPDLILKVKGFIPGMIKKRLKRMGVGTKNLNRMLESTISYVSNPRLLAKISIQLLLIIIVLPLVTQATVFFFGIRIGYVEAFVIYWVSQILGRISTVPSGYGIKDGSMVGLLHLLGGIDPLTAIQIALVHRFIVMTVPYIIIGGPASVYVGGDVLHKRKHR